MNANQSLFLNELTQFEGVKAPEKLAPVVFRELLDEARHDLITKAKAELDKLHSIETAKTDKYGHHKSAWWKQEPDGRIRVTLKDGSKTLELTPGKTAWMLPTAEDGCRFLAGFVQAAERGEIDPYLTPKVKKVKASYYDKYLTDLAAKRRAAQSEALGLDASSPELG